MRRFMIDPVIGLIAILCYVSNLIFWFTFLILVAFLQIFPYSRWRKRCTHWMNRLPIYWISGNTLIQKLTMPRTQWIIEMNPSPLNSESSQSLNEQGLNDLSAQKGCLLICNHKSWTDILILHRLFNRKIPPLKFFLKRQLLWQLPIASWACWLLNFPFVHRHTKAQLIKRPELKFQDLNNTKKACEKYQEIPTTVVNFVEGTRFTDTKHKRQQSPYQFLLRPKSGGLAFSLSVLGNVFSTLLNVTIVYPTHQASLWHFLCGQLKQIHVHVEIIKLDQSLIGNYEQDQQFRIRFQKWLNQIWMHKDQIIKEILETKNDIQ